MTSKMDNGVGRHPIEGSPSNFGEEKLGGRKERDMGSNLCSSIQVGPHEKSSD